MSVKRDAEKTIQEYLEKQNRPYSAGDIFNNLHKEFGKTAVVKALENLALQKKIIEKIYGKQKVYAPTQDRFGDIKPEELKSLDAKCVDLQGELKKLQSEIKQQENEISIFAKQMTTEELAESVENLEKLNTELTQKINKIKSGRFLITKEERQKINNHAEKMISHWRKRKRMTNDIVDGILEGYPKSKKHLLEETGVETDEEVGVALPSK